MSKIAGQSLSLNLGVAMYNIVNMLDSDRITWDSTPTMFWREEDSPVSLTFIGAMVKSYVQSNKFADKAINYMELDTSFMNGISEAHVPDQNDGQFNDLIVLHLAGLEYANTNVRKAAMDLILSRTVGNVTLPTNTSIVLSGTRGKMDWIPDIVSRKFVHILLGE